MDREQLKMELRKLNVPRIPSVMNLVDAYTAHVVSAYGPELWTAQEVADYLGLPSSAHARTMLSRRGIKSRSTESIPGQRGSARALYPADRVRALRKDGEDT